MQTYRIKYQFGSGRSGVHFVDAPDAASARSLARRELGFVKIVETAPERGSRAAGHTLARSRRRK